MKTVIQLLSFMLFLTFHANPVYAAELPAETSGEKTEISTEATVPDPLYDVTIIFHKNGGKGSMEELTVQSQTQTKLTKNAFTRTGCKFTGWDTKADGTGTKYADRENVTNLANESNVGKQITLYAQWKLDQPVIKNVRSSSPDKIEVIYQKNSGADGYEIQYSTNKTFKKTLTKRAKSTSAVLLDVTPNKKYYVRVHSYYKFKGIENYSDWSKVTSVMTKNGSTIVNTKSQYSIEADMKLGGSGTGYHAKLVMCTPTSAVSFGIQYDAYAAAPYTGKAMAMIENVSTNNVGGQQYSRPGNKSLELGRIYHLMMTVDKSGNGNVYLDYVKIGSFYQPNLSSGVDLRIEASARKNGDRVDAVFSNVKCKWNGTYTLGQKLGWTEFNQNPGLKYTITNNKTRLYGTINGISGDWDSDYNRVSEILQFY